MNCAHINFNHRAVAVFVGAAGSSRHRTSSRPTHYLFCEVVQQLPAWRYLKQLFKLGTYTELLDWDRGPPCPHSVYEFDSPMKSRSGALSGWSPTLLLISYSFRGAATSFLPTMVSCLSNVGVVGDAPALTSNF
jgi:hypothetical protein